MSQTSRIYPDLVVEIIFPPMLSLKDIFKQVSPMANMAGFPQRLWYEGVSGNSGGDPNKPTAGSFSSFGNTSLIA